MPTSTNPLRSFFPDHPNVLFVAKDNVLIADWSGGEVRVQTIPRTRGSHNLTLD